MTYLAPVAPPVPVPARDHAPAILAVAEADRAGLYLTCHCHEEVPS